MYCKCSGDCFNCKFKDCLASTKEIEYLDREERKKSKIKINKERKLKNNARVV